MTSHMLHSETLQGRRNLREGYAEENPIGRMTFEHFQ
jgi:hypothetical protein